MLYSLYMIKSTKDIRKVNAGFAKSKYYHKRNLEEITSIVKAKNKKTPVSVEKVIADTYTVFRTKYKFFKKN